MWSIYCSLMIAASILFFWIMRYDWIIPRVNFLNINMLLFFFWTFFLCLPFPYPVISLLSPTRFEILSKALVLSGSTPTIEAISYSSTDAFAWWVFLLSLVLFFNVVRNLCTENKILKRVVFVMIGIGLVEAAYGLVQALVPSMGVLWVDYVQAYLGTARGTFINRNNFAAFIEMTWPLALGLTLAMTGRVHSLKEALGSDRLNRQALMGLGIIVFLLALIFTRSRAGIVCGLIGFLAFSILARTGMKTATLHIRVLLGGIIVLLCIYTMTIGIGPIMQRFLSIGGDSGSRLDIWGDSLPIIRDHPLGIGLRNFEIVFPMYNRSLTYDKTVLYAHNDYLQLLIEAGWIGFLAIMCGFFIFLAKACSTHQTTRL